MLRLLLMQGVASFRRRSLLASTYLSNVADVTMEMNTASESAVSGVNTSVVEAVDGGTLAVSFCWKQLSCWCSVISAVSSERLCSVDCRHHAGAGRAVVVLTCGFTVAHRC